MTDDRGAHESPALSLLHEEAHAIEPSQRAAEFEAIARPDFDNLEEERVILSV